MFSNTQQLHMSNPARTNNKCSGIFWKVISIQKNLVEIRLFFF